jgi:hypothetical protein
MHILQKQFIKIMIALLIVGVFFVNAQASIVHISTLYIDSNLNPDSNPIILQGLAAGTYIVTPIINQNNGYDAWNAWAGQVESGANGYTKGWLNSYFINSNEFSNVLIVSDNTCYQTPSEAFTHARSTTFTLKSPSDVSFFLWDSSSYDNIGGMTLDVSSSPVPIPATVLLFCSALTGLIGLRRNSLRK